MSPGAMMNRRALFAKILNTRRAIGARLRGRLRARRLLFRAVQLDDVGIYGIFVVRVGRLIRDRLPLRSNMAISNH